MLICSIAEEYYETMKHHYSHYTLSCNLLIKELNSKFKTDIIQDILCQIDNEWVILWGDGNNSLFDLKAIMKLKTESQFIKYLKDNII